MAVRAEDLGLRCMTLAAGHLALPLDEGLLELPPVLHSRITLFLLPFLPQWKPAYKIFLK